MGYWRRVVSETNKGYRPLHPQGLAVSGVLTGMAVLSTWGLGGLREWDKLAIGLLPVGFFLLFSFAIWVYTVVFKTPAVMDAEMRERVSHLTASANNELDEWRLARVYELRDVWFKQVSGLNKRRNAELKERGPDDEWMDNAMEKRGYGFDWKEVWNREQSKGKG